MTFVWPDALLLLLALPLLVALYLHQLRRSARVALRYANLDVVREAHLIGGRARRHVPPLLFLLGLAAMLLAVARPTAVVTLPLHDQVVMLSMDVSGSMRATDVEPDRLSASQAAAKAFVDDLPAGVRVGVVSFAATAALVQQPTLKRDQILAAIDRFQLQRGTAIGSGLALALATVFPAADIEVGALGEDKDEAAAHEGTPPPPLVPAGSYPSAVIILLSDGQRTTGPDTMEAARKAADMGVRVYTVGVGTPAGQVIGFEGWSMRVRLDEDTLRAIARETHGEYFRAESAEDLRQAYRNLGSRLVMRREQTEVSALFAAAGAGLALIAALLSLWWYNRIL